MTAGKIATEAAALCGDRNQNLYTFERMLIPVRRAVRDLTMAMLSHDIAAVEDSHESTTITAGAVEHPDPPNDLAVPLEMWERDAASSDNADWIPMDQKQWDPAEPQVSTLRWWWWEDEKITFLGATGDREVLLRYRKSLAAITVAGSTVSIYNSENFLTVRAAAYAARLIGKNRALASDLEGMAQTALSEFFNVRVGEEQDQAIKLKPYSFSKRLRG